MRALIQSKSKDALIAWTLLKQFVCSKCGLTSQHANLSRKNMRGSASIVREKGYQKVTEKESEWPIPFCGTLRPVNNPEFPLGDPLGNRLHFGTFCPPPPPCTCGRVTMEPFVLLAFFPCFTDIFVRFEANRPNLCDEANCGLVGFPLFYTYFGCFGVSEPKFVISPFRPLKWDFLHSKTLRF